MVTLAAGFGLALFKYRLWDVELVIRPSLVYVILWLVIAGVYTAVAAGLGLFAGARLPVEVAILLTVAATLFFQPARRQLEQLADRWVFGRRDTPVEAIQSFGSSAAARSQPRDIATDLAAVTMRASYFTVSEAITNAIKYSEAEAVDITVSASEGTLRVEVADHGMGFDPGGTANGSLRPICDQSRDQPETGWMGDVGDEHHVIFASAPSPSRWSWLRSGTVRCPPEKER